MGVGINLRTCQTLLSTKTHSHVVTTNPRIAANTLLSRVLHSAFYFTLCSVVGSFLFKENL